MDEMFTLVRDLNSQPFKLFRTGLDLFFSVTIPHDWYSRLLYRYISSMYSTVHKNALPINQL